MKKIFFIMSFSIIGVLLPFQRVSASISIDPIKQTLEISPGEYHEISITAFNNTENTYNYEVNFSEFAVTNGSTVIDVDEPTSENPTSWLSTDTLSGSISANSSIDINIGVNVPLTVPGGGYYTRINTSFFDPTQSSANTTKQEYQSLLMIVVGDPKESLVLDNFNYDKQSETIQYTFYNPGNVHTYGGGVVIISQDGLTVKEEQISLGNVFPGDKRDANIFLPLDPGTYTAQLSLAVGRHLSMMSNSTVFEVYSDEESNHNDDTLNIDSGLPTEEQLSSDSDTITSDNDDNGFPPLALTLLCVGITSGGIGSFLLFKNKKINLRKEEA